MIENSFEVGIFRFDWRLFTKEDTAGHGGIWGVRSGMKRLRKNISLAAVSPSAAKADSETSQLSQW
jgi:hypothetical protein